MICKQYAKTVQTGYPNARQCRFVCTRATYQAYGKADRAAIPQKLTLAENENPRPLPEKPRHSAGRWPEEPPAPDPRATDRTHAQSGDPRKLAPRSGRARANATDGRCRRGGMSGAWETPDFYVSTKALRVSCACALSGMIGKSAPLRRKRCGWNTTRRCRGASQANLSTRNCRAQDLRA